MTVLVPETALQKQAGNAYLGLRVRGSGFRVQDLGFQSRGFASHALAASLDPTQTTDQKSRNTALASEP